ncbi:ribokinase [Longilinea arvoryzae]|uniref:Ribokinase n=1 Tax=Longilinea arvoryzae TaxID=360412 RepID=A0A0S7BB79_9CHLR|nr:ribokinase [Longilinea arvoryzae]GAP12461.1 ribokinase [Longilinea arvoryzae]
MTQPIIVVGSLNMDLVVRVARHPRLGETLLGGEFHTFPGGKGANQAVAAARLGAPVRMIGRVGRDDFGASLLSIAQSDGVDTTHVREDPGAASGVALITVSEDGQNTIVVAAGANGRLSAEDVYAAEAVFADAGAVVMQLEVPLTAVEAAARLGRKYGAATILNPAPAQPLSPELLAWIDYLVPNQPELRLLSGQTDLDAGIQTLLEQGVANLIVTLGDQGVRWASTARQGYVPAFNVLAVDTTAAGDAFVGAFAAGLAEGRSVEESLRRGCAAGALTVTRAGAQPSLPTRAELEAFLRKRGE